MSSMLGAMSILLQVSTIGTTKAMKDLRTIDRAAQATTSNINGSARNINASLMAVGRTLTQFVTLPLGIMQVVAGKAFSDFEYNLSKVTGLVGIANEQTKQWGEGILQASSSLAKGTKDLSDALYFVTTGGIRGAETLDVLKTSAKGAAVGLGETRQIADITVSAMNAYGKANLNAAQAGDVLIRSVREGKAEADELVKSMGVVFPIASKLGVSFGEVGAGMAAMTRTGTTAATSAMQLRRILFHLLKPAKQSEDALRAMGTSSQELRDSLKDGGLLETLMQIKDLMDTYGEDMVARVFPNIRALAGVLDILGENLEENRKLFKSISEAGGDLDRAFANVSETFKFKLNSAIASGNVLMVRFGEGLAKLIIPFIERLTERLEKLADWYSQLSDTQQKYVARVVLLTTVLGPVIALFAGMRSMFQGIAQMLGLSTSQTALQTAALKAQTAAIEEQTAAMAAKNIVDKADVANKTKQTVTTTTLAAAERKAAAATGLATIERNRAVIATAKYGAATKVVTATKSKALLVEMQLRAAESAYEKSVKAGINVRVANAQAIAAENAHKRAKLAITTAEANATEAASAATYRKMRADALAVAAAKAKAEADAQSTVVLNAQAAATERARLATSKFYAQTSVGSALFVANSAKVNAAQLQTVTLTGAMNKSISGLTVALSGLAKIPLMGWIALGAAIFYVVKELTKLTELEKLQSKVKNETAKSLSAETGALNAYLAIAQNEAISRKTRLEAIEKINEISPTYLGNLRLGNLYTKEAKEAIDAYNASLEEQIRIKVLQEELIETERKYQEEVKNGANAKIHWTKLIEEHQRSLYLGYMGHSDRMNRARDEAIQKYQEEYEASKKYLQDQMSDRSALTAIVEKQSKHAQSQIDSIVLAEKQYQKAVELSAKEKADAVSRITKEGKTQLEYEKEVNKVIKEYDKNLEASAQKVRDRIKEQIDLNTKVLSNAKEQQDYYKTLMQTDSQLIQYREAIINSSTRKERKVYSDMYAERENHLRKLVTENKSTLDTIISNSENAITQLEKIFEPIELQIQVNIEMNKIQQEVDKSLETLEREEQLLWAPDLSATERTFKKLTAQAEIYKKALESMTDPETGIELSDENAQKFKRQYEALQQVLEPLKIRLNLDDVDKEINGIASRIEKGKALFGDAFKPLEEEYNVLQNVLRKVQNEEIPITDEQVQYAIKRVAELDALLNGFKGNTEVTMQSIKQSIDEALRVLERRGAIFGGGDIDVVSEQLQIYENALNDVAKAKEQNISIGSKFVEGLKLNYTTLQLAVDAVNRLENEERQLTDTWLRQIEVQAQAEKKTQDINDLFLQAETLVSTWGLSMQGLTNHFYDSTKSLEEFKKVMDQLQLLKIQGILTEEQVQLFERLINPERTWTVSQIMGDMASQIEEAERKANLFGNTFGELNFQARIYRDALNDLKNIDTSLWEDGSAEMQNYIQNVLHIINLLGEVTKKEMLRDQTMNHISQTAKGLSDLLTTLSNRRLAELESQYKKESELAGKTTWEKIKLEELYQSKREALLRKQAVIEKALGIFSVVIDTAAAVMKYASNPATAALVPWVIALGAVQAATIAAQPIPMKEGGIVPYGYPNDSYPAMLSSGETVIPPKKLPEFKGFEKEREMYVVMPKGTWEVEGRKLKYIIDEENRRAKNVY